MEKIGSKEIFIKVIILLVIIITAAYSVLGCHTNRIATGDGSKDTFAAEQQTGSGDSSPAESEPDKTSPGSESNHQIKNGNKTSSESAIAPESITESNTTVDENKILLTFVTSGDNRPANNENPQPEVFAKLLKYMKQQNPAFYINTGDIIMGNTDNENVIKRQFDDYLRAKRELDVLNLVAPGNHDVANNISRKYFLEWIQKPVFDNAVFLGIKINSSLPDNKDLEDNLQEAAGSEIQIESNSTKTGFFYYFEYEDIYFIILNAYEKGYWGLIEADQLFWLGQLLEKLKDKPVFVFLHPPVYSVMNPECITDGSLHVAFSSKENQDRIRALFTQFKVDGVFSGHEHLYNSQEQDGAQYIITGGSGSPLYAPADKGGFYHFLKVQIRAKSWIMDVIDSTGNKVYTEEISFN